MNHLLISLCCDQSMFHCIVCLFLCNMIKTIVDYHTMSNSIRKSGYKENLVSELTQLHLHLMLSNVPFFPDQKHISASTV